MATMINRRRVGRYREKGTKREVNVWKCNYKGRCGDFYFFYFRQSPQLLSAADLSNNWEYVSHA